MSRKNRRQMSNSLYITVNILSVTLILMFFARIVTRAIDNSFDRRDIMLCNSAKKSGNVEWQIKCDCYYDGEPIICIYGGTYGK